MARTYDPTKLKETILFVAHQCEGDPTFGSVKLNKILWYSDFDAYRKHGEAITAARYQHQPEGPVLLAMPPIKREMQAEGLVREIQGTQGPTHKRLVALRQPDLSQFSAQEIALVTEYITKFWHVSAKKVSDYSHTTMAWRLTVNGQEIPYAAAFAADEPLGEGAEAWRKEIGRDRVGAQPR